MNPDLYDAIESVLAADGSCNCDREALRRLWLRDRATLLATPAKAEEPHTPIEAKDDGASPVPDAESVSGPGGGIDSPLPVHAPAKAETGFLPGMTVGTGGNILSPAKAETRCGCTVDAELGAGSTCPACGHRDHGASGCLAATPPPPLDVERLRASGPTTMLLRERVEGMIVNLPYADRRELARAIIREVHAAILATGEPEPKERTL